MTLHNNFTPPHPTQQVSKQTRLVPMTPESTGKENKKQPSKLPLPTANGIRFAYTDTIVRFRSDSNYCWVHFSNGKKLLLSKTIKDMTAILEDFPFYRVHNSHLVSLDHVEAYMKCQGGYLVMSDEEHIPLALRRKTGFLEKLEAYIGIQF